MGTSTLGQPRTYAVVISREITNVGVPFTYVDTFYPWGQASVINYWHFTSMSTWFKKN